MARPTFTPVFEEGEGVIRERILGRISDEWRKEPGDFIYDAVAAVPLEIKQAEINQDYILKNGFAQYAEGDKLDLRLEEIGLERIAAEPNKRTINITADAGVTIPAGYTLSTVILDANKNPLEYTTDQAYTFSTAGTLSIAVTCTTAGTIGNVPTGSEFILKPPLPGIRSIVDQGTTILGSDIEADETAWGRFDFKVKHPDTGGNKNDYIRWALEIAGVGRARCIPRWNGNGTVKVVIIDTDFQPASDTIVTNLQNYLDPGKTGLGDGKAPCGAQVTVIKATDIDINVSATVTYSAGYTSAMVKSKFTVALKNYLASIALLNDPGTNAPYNVIYTKIAALLSFTEGVANYSGLTVNGGTADITVAIDAAPTVGTVTV